MKLPVFLSTLITAMSVHAAPLVIEQMKITPEDSGASFEVKELEPGLQIVTVKWAAESPASPESFKLSWRSPSIDVYAHWNSRTKQTRGNFYNARFTSRIASGAPVQSFYNNQDINRFTYAASDAHNQMKLTTGLREEDAYFYTNIEFFSERSVKLSDYSAEVLIDTREIRYEDALRGVAQFWEKSYPPAEVPEVAKLPMYSTWYNFHQSLDPELMLEELAIAKKIGFDAVIIDDGWQTNDSARGYRYTGDWKPERLTELPQLVEKIHALDVKVLLWYSLPFVGTKAENFERFKGRYLRSFGGDDNAWVLDPRYPECREFIIGTYEKALTEWKLDGFKLDFIGWFAAQKNTVLTAEDGRDIASVNDAVQVLMTEVMTRLRKLKPDVLIEFRQPYTGPVMRTYGNMLRAIDCPNDALANRSQIADLRLISGDTAVHSDMLMWHPDEPVEDAARQVIATLYSVPQISVLLTKYPEDHLQMVTHWTDYWRENRELLLSGTFRAHSPAANYPILSASKDGRSIITLYDPRPVVIEPAQASVDVINATGQKEVIVVVPEGEFFSGEAFDAAGKAVAGEPLQLKEGANLVKIPVSGYLSLGKSG